MRLTFRRLLAYLDGVLDEQDVEVLGQKIAESEFASRLIHRIRNAKTRMRLGAPRLSGTGMGLDPNTVAEYLDYTLDEDRVPDFEKVCLESDVHLAEVSASHEILTLVLAEPAQVERSIRERMYVLPNEERRPATIDEKTLAESQRSDSPATQEASAMREVAEYLDERNEVRWRSMLLTMALSFLLVLVGLRAIGQFDSSHPLLGPLLASNDSPVPDLPPEVWDDPKQPGTQLNVDDGNTPAIEPGAPPAPALEPGAPPMVEPGSPPAPVVVVENAGPPVPGVVPGAPPAIEPATPAAEVEPAAPPVVEPGAPPVVEPGAPPAPGTPTPAPAPDSSPDTPDAPVPDAGPGDSAAPPLTPDPRAPPAPAPVEVGLFNTPNAVLARFDAKKDIWRRLPTRTVLKSGDELKVPIVFRPQIALMGGVQLTIIGPAEIRMLPPIDGKPNVEVVNGRLMVETVATANATVHLDLHGQKGELLLKSADTSVAIEVEGFLPLGKDPETDIERMVRWTTDRGHAQWILSPNTGIDLPHGQSVTAKDGTLMAPVASAPPQWVDARQRNEWENLLAIAASEAEGQFSPDRAVGLTLEELLSHRMADVQSIGAQSLAHFGNFQGFLQSLQNAKKRSFWEHEFPAMRRSLAQHPDMGKVLRKDLDQAFGGDAELVQRVYSLCLGFSNEQLKAGEAAKLVADLGHDDRAIRVLAFENLRQMTGKSRGYDPNQPEPRDIANWDKALQAGELVWKNPPAPFAP